MRFIRRIRWYIKYSLGFLLFMFSPSYYYKLYGRELVLRKKVHDQRHNK